MSQPVQPYARQSAYPPAPGGVGALPENISLPRSSSWFVDIGMAVALGCMLSATMYGQGLVAFVTSALMTTTLALRSNLPRVAMVMCTVAALLQAALVPTPLPAIMVVPVIVYSVARWSDHTAARTALGIALFGSLLGPFRWLLLGRDAVHTSLAAVTPALTISVGGCMAMVAAAYALGRRRRESVTAREQRMAAALERTRHLETERTQQQHIATVSERQRIATELHDIVAHSLSVIVVQAEGGKAIAAKRPEVAPEVLATIAETSRDALVDLRRIVGLLRTGERTADSDEDTFVPTPGLGDLPELIRKTGNARLVMQGELPVVGQALGLTVYRVVQESLTNVLKHGGPGARATVVLTHRPGRLEITIADDGRGAASSSDGQGNGLRGMRERLAVHRGSLSAQPRTGGGFTVRAVVPLEQRPGQSQTLPMGSAPQLLAQPGPVQRPAPHHPTGHGRVVQ